MDDKKPNEPKKPILINHAEFHVGIPVPIGAVSKSLNVERHKDAKVYMEMWPTGVYIKHTGKDIKTNNIVTREMVVPYPNVTSVEVIFSESKKS